MKGGIKLHYGGIKVQNRVYFPFLNGFYWSEKPDKTGQNSCRITNFFPPILTISHRNKIITEGKGHCMLRSQKF